MPQWVLCSGAVGGQLSAVSSQLGDQRSEHPFRFRHACAEMGIFGGWQKLEVSGKQQLIFELAG